MQNAQLLLNNHYDLQTILLTVLAKLSVVTLHGFGTRCFQALTDMLTAGKEIQEKVLQVIRNEVVERRMHGKTQSSQSLPSQLIWGLHDLVKETKKTNILSGLYDQFFPQWVK